MAWNAGDLVIVRGAAWRVVRATGFRDCEALDLASEHSPASTTLLLPFDRPRCLPLPRLRVVSRRRWAREASGILRTVHPCGGLQFAPPGVDLLAYQLEPALAVLRHGAIRVLVADAVGLGKTVEAGLLVREIALRHRLSRSLIVTPASVRAQWREELARLFAIDAIDANAGWLRRRAAHLPAHVNPWSLPGVYLSSFDFVKRAEALRPLEDVRWDLLVVDEAHAATPGSDRREAIHALACRARVVMLLTATPHSGDDDQFRALCAIGATGPATPPLRIFSRARVDVSQGERAARCCLLAVRPTAAEALMHRRLEAYTARLCAPAAGTRQAPGVLLATVLRKRALSSAACLALSLRRRLELLRGRTPPPAQLTLPLDDEEVGDDAAADSTLGAVVAADWPDERRILDDIRRQSETAAGAESKLRVLLRLLRRTPEAAILFTEYRDTAIHLSQKIAGAGREVHLLHGGMPSAERSAVLAAFRARGGVLVATDAASEGLNLHHRCRRVIHFELPWTPARLYQRRGRVDRIGQTRRVHEVALIARDTCEQLVLRPLMERARRSLAFDGSPLAARVPESQAAACVLAGRPLAPPTRCGAVAGTVIVKFELQEEARAEVERLALLRRLEPCRSLKPPPPTLVIPIVQAGRRWPVPPHDLALLLTISLRDGGGDAVDRTSLFVGLTIAAAEWPRAHAALRESVQDVLTGIRPSLDACVAGHIAARQAQVGSVLGMARQAAAERDGQLRRQLQSAARTLVQAGLFDRRALRAVALAEQQRQVALEDLDARRPQADQRGEQRLEGSYAIRAVVVGRR